MVTACSGRTSLSLGEKFAQRNILRSAEAIFYLYRDEVRDVVAQGRSEMDYAGVAAQRRQEMESYRQLVAPSIIMGDQPPPVTQQTSNVLYGTPTSRGRYTGPACVIHGIHEFGKMREGDVLVIPYSDAGWTPLFSKAGAVIAESGGILSHSFDRGARVQHSSGGFGGGGLQPDRRCRGDHRRLQRRSIDPRTRGGDVMRVLLWLMRDRFVVCGRYFPRELSDRASAGDEWAVAVGGYCLVWRDRRVGSGSSGASGWQPPSSCR